jgi:hypothetical protein
VVSAPRFKPPGLYDGRPEGEVRAVHDRLRHGDRAVRQRARRVGEGDRPEQGVRLYRFDAVALVGPDQPCRRVGASLVAVAAVPVGLWLERKALLVVVADERLDLGERWV